MAIDLINEVIDHAPVSLTAAERYALIVLAEDARLPSREIQHDIADPYLLGRLRMTAGSWANMRSELVKKKAIEKVEGGHNGRKARYKIPVLSEAMKVHRSGEATEPELHHRIGEPTSVKVHRSGESRFTDPVNHTYITPSTPSTTPRAEAAEQHEDTDETQAARALVAALPPAHQPGRGKHAELVAAVTGLLALGWPAAALTERLSRELPPNVGSVFAIQRDRLPPPVPYPKPAPQVARASPAGCGNGNCRAGKIEHPDGTPAWCPTCHPDRTRTPS